MDYITLGSIVSIKGGKRLPAGVSLSQIENDHPYIRVRDLNNVRMLEKTADIEYVDDETQKGIARYIVDKGDIVISIVGTIGLIAIVGDSLHHANLTENCVRLTEFSKDFDSLFLYYYLISDICQDEIQKRTVGAVQPKLPLKNIAMIPIHKIDLQTQKRIAGILSSLDDKIEVNNQINRNLEEQAKAIFKSWFVDFDPFQNGEFIDSELGRIPKGWKVGRLADIADITMGQSPSGDSYNEEGDGKVFYQGRGEFSDRFPVRRLYTTEPKRMAKAGDVLLSVRAPVGDINVANEDCCVGRGLAAITAKKGYSSFLLYTLKMNQAQFDQYNGAGTVFGCINKDALNDLKTLIPPETIVFNYENIVHPLDEQYLLNSEENKRIASIRDTLLPKLMSNKINIKP